MIWFGRKKSKVVEHVENESNTTVEEEKKKEEVITSYVEPVEKEVAGCGDETGRIKEINRNILDKMDIDIDSTVEKRDDNLYFINMLEDKDGILTNKDGALLDALELIIAKIMNKDKEERIRIEMDVDNFRSSKLDSLEEMADYLSSKVRKTSRQFTTKPLSPKDRKVIHMRLENYKDIRTYSKGEGLYKKVVVAPRNN